MRALAATVPGSGSLAAAVTNSSDIAPSFSASEIGGKGSAYGG